jgi:hypothetical protein
MWRRKASSETFPVERGGEFYEEATRGRSASHYLQVKAALALLYHVLGSPNPFAECLAPKFAPEKTELRNPGRGKSGFSKMTDIRLWHILDLPQLRPRIRF